MPRQITRFSVHQTSKVVAILYVLVGLIVSLLLILGALVGEDVPGLVFALFLPLFYGVLGYLMTAVMCVVYNVVAEWTGGIEFELSGEPPMPGTVARPPSP